MRFDCAQMENEFLRKRLQQSEERLESELASRNELEQKVRGGDTHLRKTWMMLCFWRLSALKTGILVSE